MTLSAELRAEIEERAERIAATFPPLTEEQQAKIHALLLPVVRDREKAA